MFQTEGHVKFDILLSVETAEHGSWNRQHPSTPLIELGMNDGNIRSTACRISQSKIGDSTGWSYFMTYLTFTYEADVQKGDSVAVLIRTGDESEFYKYYSNYESYVYPYTLRLYPPAVEVDIQLGQYFRVNGNLPDIKQIDFIKALCAMYGLFVVPSGVADKLKFVSLDDLFANKANAIDWSGRLIRQNGVEPERVKYTLGEYARRNMFKYADDELTAASGNGEIDIDNESLEPTKDVITLPFAASDETTVNPDEQYGTGIGAKIPLYEWDKDGTEVKMNNPKPRILQIVSDGTVEHSGDKAVGRFLPISFDRLIDKYYTNLAKTLNNAITITEKIRLTEYELVNLDFTKPVFLKQYGRYYGIVSIQTGDEYCTVELLQFPENAAVPPAFLYSLNNGETWLVNCPDNWTGRLDVKTTPGIFIAGEDMSEICSHAASSGLARRAVFEECSVVGDTLSNVNIEIDENVYSLDNIWYLHLPKGIRTVARKAFYYAHNVREFKFPEGIKTFVWQSFEYCHALRSVEFPASVTSIGEVAFGHCYDLTTIRFHGTTPPEIDYSAFHSAGSDYTSATPKRIYVPAGSAEAYYAQSGIARLVDDFGFTIVES